MLPVLEITEAILSFLLHLSVLLVDVMDGVLFALEVLARRFMLRRLYGVVHNDWV